MRKERRRPMHYHAQALYDGTVLAAFPIRKPIPKVIKRDHLRIDQEGVCGDDLRAAQELVDEKGQPIQGIMVYSLQLGDRQKSTTKITTDDVSKFTSLIDAPSLRFVSDRQ